MFLLEKFKQNLVLEFFGLDTTRGLDLTVQKYYFPVTLKDCLSHKLL